MLKNNVRHAPEYNYPTEFMAAIDTIEHLHKDRDHWKARAEKLDKEWQEEHRVLALLVAAGHVTEDKVEQARELLRKS